MSFSSFFFFSSFPSFYKLSQLSRIVQDLRNSLQEDGVFRRVWCWDRMSSLSDCWDCCGKRPELQNSEGQRLQLWAQTPPEAACRRVAVSLLRVKGLCAPSAGWGAQILRSKFSGLIPSWWQGKFYGDKKATTIRYPCFSCFFKELRNRGKADKNQEPSLCSDVFVVVLVLHFYQTEIRRQTSLLPSQLCGQLSWWWRDHWCGYKQCGTKEQHGPAAEMVNHWERRKLI